MAKRTKNGGWLALYPKNVVQEVTDLKLGSGSFQPTGIFVSGNPRVGIFINYAGVDTNLAALELPPVPEILRDVAEAIVGLADDIERQS